MQRGLGPLGGGLRGEADASALATCSQGPEGSPRPHGKRLFLRANRSGPESGCAPEAGSGRCLKIPHRPDDIPDGKSRSALPRPPEKTPDKIHGRYRLGAARLRRASSAGGPDGEVRLTLLKVSELDMLVEHLVRRQHSEYICSRPRQHVFGLLPKVWEGLLQFGKVRPDKSRAGDAASRHVGPGVQVDSIGNGHRMSADRRDEWCI